MKYPLVIIVGLLVMKVSYAGDVINWHKIHWPPKFILDGADKGQGNFDELNNLYIKALPQYQHKKRTSTNARLWLDIKNGLNICDMAALQTPERETFALFSHANIISLSPRIIINKSSFNRLKLSTKMSLHEFLKTTTLTGYIEKNRSFGPVLDPVINDSAISSRPLTPRQILKMVAMARVDFTLEFPSVVNYILKNNPIADNIVMIQLTETLGYLFGKVACTKNDWGRKVIRDINLMLEREIPHEQYFNLIMKWQKPGADEWHTLAEGFNKEILAPIKHHSLPVEE